MLSTLASLTRTLTASWSRPQRAPAARPRAPFRPGSDLPLEDRLVPSCLAWGTQVSAAFRQKIKQIAADLGTDPDFLMAAMAFESQGTFSPSVKNPKGSATGLIQFTEQTAKGLGTTTADLAALTAEQQLDYVEKYFAPYKGRINSVDDVYMAILDPAGIGKSGDTVLFSKTSKSKKSRQAYKANKLLDKNHDGKITKDEAVRIVKKKLKIGQGAQFCAMDDPSLASIAPASTGGNTPPPPTPNPTTAETPAATQGSWAEDVSDAAPGTPQRDFLDIGATSGTFRRDPPLELTGSGTFSSVLSSTATSFDAKVTGSFTTPSGQTLNTLTLHVSAQGTNGLVVVVRDGQDQLIDNTAFVLNFVRK
jgi:hypothetical protein